MTLDLETYDRDVISISVTTSLPTAAIVAKATTASFQEWLRKRYSEYGSHRHEFR